MIHRISKSSNLIEFPITEFCSKYIIKISNQIVIDIPFLLFK